MAQASSEQGWRVRWIRSSLSGLEKLPLPEINNRLRWLIRPVRPAEMGNGLRDALLDRDNMLEDVNYQKVVPNHFIVEVSPDNYSRSFRPIESQILQQWRNRLLQEIITANSRQGRKEFRFGGRLVIEIRPAAELADHQGRILARVEQVVDPPPVVDTPAAARPHVPAPQAPGSPDRRPIRQGQGHVPPAQQIPETLPGPGPQQEPLSAGAAYLEIAPSGQRWALYPGVNTIGRNETAQIHLDHPVVQEKRLVSGLHCYIVMEQDQCTLFDGAPDGRPSANGTYVNLRRVGPGGYRLQNGDAVVLAAIDPLYPRSDTPGVVTFYYWSGRRG